MAETHLICHSDQDAFERTVDTWSPHPPGARSFMPVDTEIKDTQGMRCACAGVYD